MGRSQRSEDTKFNADARTGNSERRGWTIEKFELFKSERFSLAQRGEGPRTEDRGSDDSLAAGRAADTRGGNDEHVEA